MSGLNLSRPGSLRPSQIISTFGPGSIYDVLYDSILIMGIDFWNNSNYTVIVDERLIGHLKNFGKARFRNIETFRIPTSSGNKDNVSVTTFPRWGECPRCHKLTRRDGNPLHKSLKCPDCKTATTHPARLITACKNGHMDDFPWQRWVEHKKDCDDNHLYLRQGAKTVSLRGLEVQCDNCGATKHLGDALKEYGLKWLYGKCNGKRPWLQDFEECNKIPRGLLKGASNVYFSSTVDALYIPPFTDEINKMLKRHYPTLSYYLNEPEMLRDMIKKILPNYDTDEVLKRMKVRNDTTEGRIQIDIKNDEWNILNGSHSYNHEDFKTEIIKEMPYKFRNILEKLVLVRRLKETRVLIGFTRIDPPDLDSLTLFNRMGQISMADPIWLPAAELFGEGLFFSINENLLHKWEKIDNVVTRNRAIINQSNMSSHGAESLPPPRFIMLHTLSHLLIREMATYAGYSSASIRERIYGEPGMSGILLYTSSASSDGSLGGLVNLGKNAFELILSKAIQKSRTCSSDPLCAFHNPEMTRRNNGASCHACCFVPETSCINMNSLLDRTMVYRPTVAKNNAWDKETPGGFFEFAEYR